MMLVGFKKTVLCSPVMVKRAECPCGLNLVMTMELNTVYRT